MRFAKGDPQAPLSSDELWVKFDDCIRWSGAKLDAGKLFAQLSALDKLSSVNDLYRARTPAPRKRRAAKK